MAIGCHGRKMRVLEHIFFHCKVVFLFVLVSLYHLQIGIYNNNASGAVNNDYATCAYLFGNSLESDNCGIL